MQSKFLPSVVVPFLLIVTGTVSSLSLIYKWNYELSAYAIFLFTLVYILIFERLIPFKKAWSSKKSELWMDIRHLIFSTTVFDAFAKMLAVSFVLLLQKHFFKEFPLWERLPFIITFVLANIIGEFFPYLYHRISHKGNKNSFLSLFLWKTHAIHHLPNSLNWFKTNWIHPLNMFLNTSLKILPLLLLGFGEEIIYLVGVMHIVIAYLSHANIRTTKSFFDYIIVTPRIHHFHHSTILAEAKNYGNIIPFWDLIFGTYYNRKGEVAKVGIADNDEQSYPTGNEFLSQLKFPLVTTRQTCCKGN